MIISLKVKWKGSKDRDCSFPLVFINHDDRKRAETKEIWIEAIQITCQV